MRFRFKQHVNADELLAWMDGELKARRARAVKKHVEACWECRAAARKIDETIGCVLELRKNRGRTSAPEDEVRLFRSRLAERASRIPVGRTGIDAGSFLRITRWPAVVGIGMWVTFLLVTESGTKVSANEVIARAMDAQRRELAAHQGRLIRQTLKITASRPSWRGTGAVASVLLERTGDTLSVKSGDGNTINDLLQRAGWRTSSMLSASALREWRDRLAVKHEEVQETTLNDGGLGERVIINTGRVAGPPEQDVELAAVSLLVRKSDGRPLQETFQFRSKGEPVSFDVRESAVDIVRTSAESKLEPRTSVLAPGASVPPKIGRPQAVVPPPVDLAESEVEVRFALHRAHACLGEAIEVVTDRAGYIVVGGIVETAERKQELLRLCQRMPGLRVNLKEKSDIPEPDRKYRVAKSRRLKPLGPSEEGIGSRELQHIRAEAWALRRLASLYPPAVLHRLSVRSQWLVEAMLRDHISELKGQLAQLPDFGPDADKAVASELEGSRFKSWDEEIAGLFVAVEKLEDSPHRDASGNEEIRARLLASTRAVAAQFSLLPDIRVPQMAEAVKKDDDRK